MRILSVEATTHGRVLVRDATRLPAAGAVVAFHGYGQSAEAALRDLEAVAGIDAWTVVAVQALHRFYTRAEQAVIASWMTRQDRDEAITDNVAYVDRAVEAAGAGSARIVFAGFSQGAGMAYRAALLGRQRAHGVIALAGDIPPDLNLAGAPAVLIGAGTEDSWYTAAKVRADMARLDEAGVPYEVVSFAGGHGWSDVFRTAVAGWLARR